ncbi:hypothetical protein SEA_LULWA_82 [Mycobacterium phage Lulwa]|uniref:Uncharacterized protein n=4 Tax=Pegunavirus TaxID=1623295 RepID=A0A1I9SBJ3_9CAUD|nr:hypothetical protein SEA_MITKAO_85 [Mycobacterium phage MitKao]AOZ64220.1 hypothetical protein SEA_HELD_83 [Mycobacterium phage Held]ARB11405.1 hypothetical protein SEA_CHORKPOP_86 [Mycobacterium phage Chorkpop]AXQ64881.1 hypothetical protein SEA_PODRICK_84 [Mycobacterium phage Podrick]QGJ87708.1 hypothetical protein SEA_KLOPPINATOR_85 [Mycobacterium phage Kloppinator]QSM00190.1 hypothetical protein SEA_LULWA_82 [Mycobacterium phage Lulwa]
MSRPIAPGKCPHITTVVITRAGRHVEICARCRRQIA